MAEAVGGNVEFKMFRVTPVSANAEVVDFSWPDGNGIKAIKLRGITSRISPLSLFSSALKGEEAVAREGEVFLGGLHSAKEAAPTTPASGKSIRFSRVSVTKLNVTAGDPAQPAVKLTSSEVVLHVDETNLTRSLKVHRGNLAIAAWPPFKIDRALLQIHPDAVELVGLRLNDTLTPRGTLDLSGTLHPFDSAQHSTLAVKLDNFNLADLLGQDCGKLIDARIDSRSVSNSNSLSFKPDSLDSVELAIAFRSAVTSRVSLTGFPFLKSLARTLGDKWYEQPNLEESIGTIVRKGATVELRDLDFERKSHMAVKGSLAADAEKNLTGSLEIGIPSSVVQLSPNLKTETLFSPEQDGFRWLKVTIGGTLAHPADNFAELYAVVQEMAPADPGAPGAPAPTPESDPGKAFDDLTRPPGR